MNTSETNKAERHQKVEMAFKDATYRAIEEMGLEQFKKTSFFHEGRKNLEDCK